MVVVKPTDIVQLRQHGRLLLAVVKTAPIAGRFAIEPVERGTRTRSAHLREIQQRWEKTTPSPAAPGGDQLRLDVDFGD